MTKNLTSIAPTTVEIDQAIATLAPEISRAAFALLNDYSRRQAIGDAKAKDARDARTAELEAVVIRAIKDDLAVIRVTRPHKRTDELRGYLKEHVERYGVVPSDVVIRRVLKERCVIQRPYSYFIMRLQPDTVNPPSSNGSFLHVSHHKCRKR